MTETTPLRIVDYGPYTQSDQAPGDPGGFTPPPLSQMEEQIDFIADKDFANAVRLYTFDDQQGSLINYAIQQDGLNVIPSVYLTNPNSSPTDKTPASWSTITSNPTVMSELNNCVSELESLPASDFSKIPFIVIGNEAISQVGGWSDSDIEMAIQYVKDQLAQTLPQSIVSQLQFTTAETYEGQYINLNGDSSFNPNDARSYTATNMGLNSNINVIFANVYGYWDGISVDQAAAHVDEIYQELKTLYPNKQIVISETGWPSAGPTQQSAVASLSNEQTFWQDFLPIANQQNISFGAFEAYDEPNKNTNGSDPAANVENNWGLIEANSGPTYTSSTFKTAITSIMPPPPADFYNDNTSAIAIQNTDGQMYLLQEAGAGGNVGNYGSAWHFVGDDSFFSDGNPDILLQNTSGQMYLLDMQGNDVVGGGNVGNYGSDWNAVATGGFFSDGDQGIALQNTDGQIYLLDLQGSDVVGGDNIGNYGSDWHVKATGDFFGDDHTDLVLQNTGGDIYLFDVQNSVVQGGNIGNFGSDWQVVGAGKFLSDGNTDLVLQNTDGQIGLLDVQGSTVVGFTDVGNFGASWQVKQVGDFFGDGHSGIALQNTSGQIYLEELNGGTISQSANLGNYGASWHLPMLPG
ncbi:MAG TPA: glycosyl hydrolase family 17 protein [Stellaceae bacterium]|jgi:exo-beta-1,3-glucanase (GH17 family)